MRKYVNGEYLDMTEEDFEVVEDDLVDVVDEEKTGEIVGK